MDRKNTTQMMALAHLAFMGGHPNQFAQLPDDGSWNQPPAEPPKPPTPKPPVTNESIPLKERRKQLAKILREKGKK